MDTQLPWFAFDTVFYDSIADYVYHLYNEAGCDSLIRYNLFVYWNGDHCDTTLSYYNVVTPNGDGTNDRFVIGGLIENNCFKYNELTIFDRWGTTVYHKRNIINEDSQGIGEICVKGPNVMLGYYKDEALTNETIDEFGYLHTGDLGSMGEDGILRIHGRIKNVIVTKNGKNIYPEEIEYHLNNNPLIAESMVVGFDDAENDETLVEAKIFPDFEAIKKKYTDKGKDVPTGEELSKLFDDIIKDINKKLPNYKNVKKVTLREKDFIKTTTMKIKRYANMDDDSDKEVSSDNPLK